MVTDANNDLTSAMSELGIDPNTLDESSDLEIETESMEAEGEIKEEIIDTESDLEDDSEETIALEGEEKEKAITETENVEEEPKLTAKEFREIENAKAQLEQERNAFMEQRASTEKEFQEKYHEKVKTHDQMDDFLAALAEKDPELFDLIKGEFQDHLKQYSNPVISKHEQKILELEKKLDSFTAKASDEVTLTKLDSEMEKFNSGLGKEAEALGIKVDPKVIEGLWSKGLTVEEAFNAKYGDALRKASISKAKVEAVTKKTEARPKVATAGTLTKSTAQEAKSYDGMSLADVLRHEAKKFTGKLIT